MHGTKYTLRIFHFTLTCASPILSVFKFGISGTVILLLVWKLIYPLKTAVKVRESKGISLLKSWLRESKFCIASGGSQSDDCFAAPGKALVLP